jgi:hypothetical protein
MIHGTKDVVTPRQNTKNPFPTNKNAARDEEKA